MNASRRPISVLVIACLYLAVGCIGFVFHFRELRHPDGLSVELTEILAVVAGVFMLRGRNWARWLALVWMAFHVVLSAFGAFRELAIHAIIFAGIAWLLFRADAKRYFRSSDSQANRGT